MAAVTPFNSFFGHSLVEFFSTASFNDMNFSVPKHSGSSFTPNTFQADIKSQVIVPQN